MNYTEEDIVGLINGADPKEVTKAAEQRNLAQQALQGAVALWGFDLPPARKWIIPEFLPEGCVTLLNADGGIGKSYLAMHIGLCVSMGMSCFHKKVPQGRVLYLDFEMDSTEIKRRMWQLLTGRGLTTNDSRLVGNFYYLRCKGSLAQESLQHQVSAAIEYLDPALIILDSLTVATAIDQNDQNVILPAMRFIETMGTTLALDHVPASGAKEIKTARGLGSVMKRNIARQAWNLGREEDGHRVLYQSKSNFGGDHGAIRYWMDFGTPVTPHEPKPVHFSRYLKRSKEQNQIIKTQKRWDEVRASLPDLP